jgi:hypothetical protein
MRSHDLKTTTTLHHQPSNANRPLFGDSHACANLLVVWVVCGFTNAVVHAESYFTNAIFCADTTATVCTGCSRLSRGHGF